MIPPVEALEVLKNRLQNANINFALGGSGLMFVHGLSDHANDWDITTDATWEQIEPIVKDLNYTLIPPQGMFATRYLCKIELDGAVVDLMGDFSITTESETYLVPTKISGSWNGFPLGSLPAWGKAYDLMGRKEKARRVQDYVRSTKIAL